MEALAIFEGVKLFLEIINDGPSAIVKGVVMSVIPGGTFVDVGETFGLFDLSGNYCGDVPVDKLHYVSIGNYTLLNKDQLLASIQSMDFPELARKEFAKFQDRKFPSLNDRDFPKF